MDIRVGGLDGGQTAVFLSPLAWGGALGSQIFVSNLALLICMSNVVPKVVGTASDLTVSKIPISDSIKASQVHCGNPRRKTQVSGW